MSARADRRPARDANDAGAVRRRQLLLFSVIAAALLVAVAAWLGMGGGKTDAPQGGIDAGIVDPDIAETVWTRRSEARLNKVEDALKRMEQEAERAADRRSQVGSGDRSERIRTYNFPQGRVTDHRINLTLHQLPKVLEGDLDEMVDALAAEDQAARLAAVS